MNLSITDAIAGAQGKAAGVFEADLARVLCSVTRQDWEMVRWIKSPDAERFVDQPVGEKKSITCRQKLNKIVKRMQSILDNVRLKLTSKTFKCIIVQEFTRSLSFWE
jgi:hypothetical protein